MDAFLALADPTRRSIVQMLSHGPLAAGDVAAKFKISPPAVSQHLKVLREARIVDMRVDAQRRVYQLNGAGLREVDEWLARYRKFWFTALDALEAQLKADRIATREKPGRKQSRSRGRHK